MTRGFRQIASLDMTMKVYDMTGFDFTRRAVLKAGVGSGLAILAGGLPAFAAQGSLPDYYPADYQKIIDGSKEENRLFIYSNISAKSWAGVQRRFNELYPWIRVEILELSGYDLMERHLAEAGTGAPTCDLISTTIVEKWIEYVEKDVILPYKSPEEQFYPAWSKPANGLYTIAIDPLLMIYNKLLLKEDLQPKGLGDLARLVKENPDLFKGRIAVIGADTNPSSYVGHKGVTDLHGEEAWEWFRTFGPSTKSERQAGTVVDKVLSGEYLVSYFQTSGVPWQAAKDPAKAQVLGWDFIHDGQPLVIRAAAVPKAAKNVNSAKLWLDVTLSFQGQVGLVEGGRTPLRSDVTKSDVNGDYTLTSIVEEVGEKNVIMPSYDAAQFKTYDDYIAKWREAFARK